MQKDLSSTASETTDLSTTLHVEMSRVSSALALLGLCAGSNQLLQLRNLCINNGGTWTVPEDPETYKPCFFEAQLFKIHAMARDPEDLPRNWMIAAQRELEGYQQEGALT